MTANLLVPASTDQHPLPHRPRLLPGLAVLPRNQDEIQIGLDPRHAVIVAGLPRLLRDTLTQLAGQFTTQELVDRTARSVADRQQVLALLSTLTAIGLIEDSAPGNEQPIPANLAADTTMWALRTGLPRTRILAIRGQALVIVAGNGMLGPAVARLLAAAGVGWVHPRMDGVVQPEDLGNAYLDRDLGKSRQEASRALLRREAPHVHTSRPGQSRRPDLVVLTDAIIPRLTEASGLMDRGIPHLYVRMQETTGLVGPLVFPGRTSCLWCAETHRADRDPDWRNVAAQLEGQPSAGAAATVQATAALAAGQVLLTLAWVGGGRLLPSTWNAILEIDGILGSVKRRSQIPHPRCRCLAARSPGE